MYKDFVRKDDNDFYGNDIPVYPVQAPDYASCGLKCSATPGCNAFTYVKSSQECYPKSRMGDSIYQVAGATTGYNRKSVNGLLESTMFSVIATQ